MSGRIQHRLTKDGGFAAIDHCLQVAYYAYPTSDGAATYAKSPDRGGYALEAIAHAAKCRCSEQIGREYYQHIRDTYFT